MAQPAPTADCLGMLLKLNLPPIAGQDVVIRRCERKTTDPTDDISVSGWSWARYRVCAEAQATVAKCEVTDALWPARPAEFQVRWHDQR